MRRRRVGDEAGPEGTSTGAEEDPGGDASLWPPIEDAAECVLTPDVGDGPYYFDTGLVRVDVREDRPGAELRLRLWVMDDGCRPLPGVTVDIFHCDAGGVYGGYDNDPDLPPMFGTPPDTSITFCRGIQVTDDEGRVEFVTIYPGWYTTRAPHIHVRATLGDGSVVSAMVLFDHDTTVALYQGQAPYSSRPQMHTTNETDTLAAMGVPILSTVQQDGVYWGALTMRLPTPS